MNESKTILFSVTRIALFFLSACLFAWVFVEPYRSYFAGLALGTLVSMLNMFHLAWRVERFTYLAAMKMKTRFGLGLATRVALAALAVIFAHKSASLEVLTTIVGLGFAQLVILILGVGSAFSKK